MSSVLEDAPQNGPSLKRKSDSEAIADSQPPDPASQSSCSPNDHPLTQADPVAVTKLPKLTELEIIGSAALMESYGKKIDDLDTLVSGLIKLFAFVHELNAHQRTFLLAKLMVSLTSVHKQLKMIKPAETAKELYSLLIDELSTTEQVSELLVSSLEAQ